MLLKSLKIVLLIIIQLKEITHNYYRIFLKPITKQLLQDRQIESGIEKNNLGRRKTIKLRKNKEILGHHKTNETQP